MGWSGGTDVFCRTYNNVRENLNEDARWHLLDALIPALESQDWDCLYEIIDEEWPEVEAWLMSHRPEMFDDE